MLEQESFNGPALTVWPSVHETLVLPTPRVAVPSLRLPRDTVDPRTSAFAPSPDSVMVHVVPEQETLSELNEHPASGTTVTPAASRPPASRTLRSVAVEDMRRA